MMGERDDVASSECIVPNGPPPIDFLNRYAVERDPHLERDIANYVEAQARNEVVKHVERIREDVVMGMAYEIWDVTTDVSRWWVLTNLTNLYSQRDFPSLDYVLSFHIGLMMRLRSRPDGARVDEPSPFDDVFRRQEQAKDRFDTAVEAEDYQAVGLQLRECLLSLIGALRRRVDLGGVERPQDSNFKAWADVLMEKLCAGGSNKELRRYLKVTADSTWQLVNWLTHDRDANKTAAFISIQACDTVVGHCVQILQRSRTDRLSACPICTSRQIRSHFDLAIGPDGDYYESCASCEWDSHPGAAEQPREIE